MSLNIQLALWGALAACLVSASPQANAQAPDPPRADPLAGLARSMQYRSQTVASWLQVLKDHRGCSSNALWSLYYHDDFALYLLPARHRADVLMLISAREIEFQGLKEAVQHCQSDSDDAARDAAREVCATRNW